MSTVQLALQFVGASGILLPFALHQFRMTDQHSYLYLLCNLVGALILAILAFIESQWGFVILQGVWALAAARGVGLKLRRRPTLDERAG